MKILSIDVGIKNLSYCCVNVDKESIEVLAWENVCVIESNCKKTSLEELTEHMLIALNIHFDDKFEADVVLIENQPMLKNGLMKTMSVVIYTFFNILRLQFGNVGAVKFISACNKLKCKKFKELDKQEIKTYKDRKQASVKLATKYVETMFPEKNEWFKSLHKNDDVADCMLFAIYYIEHVLKFDTIVYASDCGST